ncbi:MAG: superoxide dismutase [Pseudomonadota bacterium]|nr:superoxide dismutase [Pseudomonadota bacterium]
MKIMAISRRVQGATYEDIQRLQVPEVKKVWQGIGDGTIREIYFDPQKPCVVVILETNSPEAARAYMAELPMVQQKLIDFDYTVLGPFTQLSHLFAERG